MRVRSFADRIGEFLPLSASEREAVEQVQGRSRSLRRGAVLVRENDRTSDLYVVSSGMMMSYVLLDDGSRQILRFLFPGDLTGASALAYAHSPECVAALCESVVCLFDRAQVAEVLARHPRLALALTAIDQAERAAMTDRLAGLGRTSAQARIAAVLLDIRDRLRRGGEDVERGFTLPLTQEEIGDASGLTAVHVNRMLRQLEEMGLIARHGTRVILADEARLKRAAKYVDRLSRVDLSWMVPAGA
ncbi:cAMP-binding domain of CRP or a regulatory subunit of cAMP-dependent protein kinases [Sphingomonas palmae]|uniref:cAMP-binding domain of CRP or a regulatory subunit of cAMP-dependent protein kinases n=1 Tax=Sphingomonas palmae TaxID=1855283 RepID=A0A1H7UID1_9SPHN|nr:Crp/Fnr family transcriptional regulator [Sphingomonas palmae]SEL96792.1 cAMP-binding domain of CRP or a regulatory subunit of cAMP-dependent protein kinases [Sphingomonas palmae]